MIELSRRLYRRFAGQDAFIAHVPLAVLRAIHGDFATVRVGDRKITVDLRDDILAFHLYFSRVWEPNETAYAVSAIRPGDRVLDIGANLGYYTTLFGRLVGAGGRVMAIEAAPRNAELLARNVAQNDLTGVVEIVCAAAGSGDDVAPLYTSKNNFGGHTLVKPARYAETIPVEVVAVDDLVASWERLDFVKIDVEGYEPMVFAGMRATLERFPDVQILCEFDPTYVARAGFDPFAFLDGLGARGFGISVIGPGGEPVRTDVTGLRAALEGTREAKNLLLRR